MVAPNNCIEMSVVQLLDATPFNLTDITVQLLGATPFKLTDITVQLLDATPFNLKWCCT
jgi:hypothetical protein